MVCFFYFFDIGEDIISTFCWIGLRFGRLGTKYAIQEMARMKAQIGVQILRPYKNKTMRNNKSSKWLEI